MKLHNYYRSFVSIRVRVALALKGLHYQYEAINLHVGETRPEPPLFMRRSCLIALIQGIERGHGNAL